MAYDRSIARELAHWPRRPPQLLGTRAGKGF